MPFQRKSCDACFAGRRKCDLAFPACSRCQRSRKPCHYVAPQTPESSASDDSRPANNQLVNTAIPAGFGAWDMDMAFHVDFDNTSLMMEELIKPSIPNMLGELGELQPVTGNTRTWEWVIEQLKNYPRDFALRAENVFIHKNFLQHPGSGPLRAAFGICAGCICRAETNEFMIFDTLNAEMSTLAQSGTRNNPLEEALATFQAIVLYQIIRLFYGDSKQRVLAEHQKSYIAAWGLQLLHRARDELQDAQPAWETWLLTESIRRTVMVAFIAHSVYAVFQHGVCPEMPTLSVLPVSSKQGFWSSQEDYMNHFPEEETMKYPEFTSLWTISPPRTLEPFEKMILVACKGIESVEAFTLQNGNQG